MRPSLREFHAWLASFAAPTLQPVARNARPMPPYARRKTLPTRRYKLTNGAFVALAQKIEGGK